MSKPLPRPFSWPAAKLLMGFAQLLSGLLRNPVRKAALCAD